MQQPHDLYEKIEKLEFRVSELEDTGSAIRTMLREELKPIKDVQEQHSKKLNELTEIVSEHSKILNEHSKILKELTEIVSEHSKILSEHSKILNEHSKILNEHSKILGEHSQTLSEHSKILSAVQLDIRGIIKILADNRLILDDPDN